MEGKKERVNEARGRKRKEGRMKKEERGGGMQTNGYQFHLLERGGEKGNSFSLDSREEGEVRR